MAGEKSERLVVPLKQGNRFRLNPGEGRGRRVTELLGGNMPSASELDYVSTKQQQIAELAKQSPQMGFTSLNHHIDLRWLYEAYKRVRPDAAPGVDGQTNRDYNANLRGNLESLLERAKSGTYYAPPVRRVHIPKGTGSETRPIGIPTFEDKILQRAVVMVLEAVYEQDFHNCSYGFRPGRSAHQALDELWQQTMRTQGGWIVEVDIRKFFDTLDHAHLRELLRRRIRDGVLLRLIDKWLNAGVLESGNITYPDQGSPQGGVISPLLANVYLHYVLDVWFEQEVKPRLRGQAFLIRYADDFVIGFTCEEDARRVLEVLPKRFGKYGLTIHPDKTRLVAFQPPASSDRTDSGGGTPSESFDLLGFTHFWARSRKGNWVVKRSTAASRLRRAITTIAQWCRLNCHMTVGKQHQKLSLKLRGHCGYYGITGNGGALRQFRDAVLRAWREGLSCRTRGYFSWDKFNGLLGRYPLPAAVVVHSVYRARASP
jgi:group II intron reverse transcriptase/maturase